MTSFIVSALEITKDLQIRKFVKWESSKIVI